jgi:hypothetical protein
MADDPLEASLRDALRAEVPSRPGPDDDRIAALRAAAAAQRSATPGDAPVRSSSIAPVPARAPAGAAPAWQRRLLVAASVLVAFLAGALVAARPPAVVRDAAHSIGFDVDSSDLVDARARLDDLGSALAIATARRVDGALTEADLEAVARTDQEMLRAIGRLDDDERAALVPTAHQVHLRAVVLFLEQGRDLPTAQARDLEELRPGS